MYDRADGGSGSGGTGGKARGREDEKGSGNGNHSKGEKGPEVPPTGDPESGETQTIELEGRDGENAPFANEETVAHENEEGYNEEGKQNRRKSSAGIQKRTKKNRNVPSG